MVKCLVEKGYTVYTSALNWISRRHLGNFVSACLMLSCGHAQSLFRLSTAELFSSAHVCLLWGGEWNLLDVLLKSTQKNYIELYWLLVVSNATAFLLFLLLWLQLLFYFVINVSRLTPVPFPIGVL